MTTQPLHNRFSKRLREMFTKRPPNRVQTRQYKCVQQSHHTPSDVQVQPVESTLDRRTLKKKVLGSKQLLLHFLISGGALRGGRGSQRRVRSRSILDTIFESSSLARVSCFLILLWVLKATLVYLGKVWKVVKISR